MLKNASNQAGANSVTVAPLKTKCWYMVASKAAVLENYLAVSTWILNATRRSINLSVYLVFDLEAGRFKFLGENLLGAGGVHFSS